MICSNADEDYGFSIWLLILYFCTNKQRSWLLRAPMIFLRIKLILMKNMRHLSFGRHTAEIQYSTLNNGASLVLFLSTDNQSSVSGFLLRNSTRCDINVIRLDSSISWWRVTQSWAPLPWSAEAREGHVSVLDSHWSRAVNLSFHWSLWSVSDLSTLSPPSHDWSVDA